MRTEPLSLWVPGVALSERKRQIPGGPRIDTPDRRDYKAYVKGLVARNCPEPFEPKWPLEVTITFVREYPRKPRKRNPRPEDVAPVTAPDLTNTWKLAEDAMQGVVYLNDAQIVSEKLVKVYGPAPGVRVRVRRMALEECNLANMLLELYPMEDGT